MKLKIIHQEIKVKVTAEEMWNILAQYGDVSRFHGGVVESRKEPGSENTASLGCERVCNVVDLGLHITLKERIVDFVAGKSCRYEVYEWKNLLFKKCSLNLIFRTQMKKTPS